LNLEIIFGDTLFYDGFYYSSCGCYLGLGGGGIDRGLALVFYFDKRLLDYVFFLIIGIYGSFLVTVVLLVAEVYGF